MKKARFLIYLIFIIIGMTGCVVEQEYEAGFKDQEQMTIYDYIVENEENYSSFLSILKNSGIDKTLSAYNPDGNGYTLFLPGNEAIDMFIDENSQFSSLNDLLNDLEYVSTLSRYHIVNQEINSNDFPFGALPEYTLSGDLLTVSFVIGTDSSYYKINNQAPVIKQNIELSNGYVHIISRTLVPITYTSYDWLEQHTGYSIFKAAIDATGLKEIIDINIKDKTVESKPNTLLVEPDSVFNKRGIFSLNDLAALISPDNTDYASLINPLYNFTAYHILTDSRFLDDFAEIATNYSTFSDIPVNINGLGLDIVINKGKEMFDTIVNGPDTVFINFVGFYYDESNVITQSGAIHFIDQILRQQTPSRAIQTFEFYEEPLFNEFRLEPGDYLVEDSSALQVIKWSGTDLFFVESANLQSPAWGNDWLFLDGDFIISYNIPKIIQGNYTVFLGAEAFNSQNALIEVFIDGKNTGGLIDLATGGSSTNPFARIELGTTNFIKYENHTIEIRSLIPGTFSWDYIRFEPVVD